MSAGSPAQTPCSSVRRTSGAEMTANDKASAPIIRGVGCPSLSRVHTKVAAKHPEPKHPVGLTSGSPAQTPCAVVRRASGAERPRPVPPGPSGRSTGRGLEAFRAAATAPRPNGAPHRDSVWGPWVRCLAPSRPSHGHRSPAPRVPPPSALAWHTHTRRFQPTSPPAPARSSREWRNRQKCAGSRRCAQRAEVFGADARNYTLTWPLKCSRRAGRPARPHAGFARLGPERAMSTIPTVAVRITKQCVEVRW